MRARSLCLGTLFGAWLPFFGCSDGSSANPTDTGVAGMTAAAGAAGAGSGGAEGSIVSAGTSGAAGESTAAGGVIGSGGAGGTTSEGGAAGESAAGAGGAAAEDYACSEFLGPNVTGEWFAAGFEDHVDNDQWQVKAPHHSLVEDWAQPNHEVWLEQCQGQYYDCETRSACAGAEPDRIIFVTAKIDYLGTPQATWEQDIEAAIETIKGKYPEVRHIELMTFVRSPEGENCGEQTTVSPNLDAAHEAVADRSAGFVSVAPKFFVPNCGVFSAAPHMTAEGNATMGNMIGEYYASE